MRRLMRVKDENGVVSILVAMIIMTLLMLIAVGFAALMRREQRQALDRQLSTQAFYAAESGVNDAREAVKTAIQNGTALPNTTTCPSTRKDVDASRGIAYTCLLIDPAPTSAEYDLGANESAIVPLSTTGGEVINSLTISWQDSTNPSTAINNGAHQLAPFSGSSFGILRASIMPINNGGSIPDRNTLINMARTYFLYPNNAGTSTTAYGTLPDGQFLDGRCAAAGTTKQCTVVITGLGARTNMYLRLKAIYKPISVVITAQGAAGTNVKLVGSQVVIDSTGRASDVLRRIQVRMPVNSTSHVPEFGLEAMTTICKRFTAWPGGATPDPSNPACAL